MAGREATIDDLYHVHADGKAEIVNGEIVLVSPTGYPHGYAAREIIAGLREYERATGHGRAIPDPVAFVVDLPNRRSFCPDAAFHIDRLPRMGFIEGAPVFAAEVRSEEDDGPAAERRLATKRADYFAAGTLVVWDVDVLREGFVKAYRARDPESPTTYCRGDRADAEPAVPGWSMPVDDLFLPE